MSPDPAQTKDVSPQAVLESLTKMRSFRLRGAISEEAHLLSQTKLAGNAARLHRSRLGGMMVYTTESDGSLTLSLVTRDGQVHSKADLGRSESEISARLLSLEGTRHWIVKAGFNGEISCTPFKTENGKYVRETARLLPQPRGFASALGFDPYHEKLAVGMYGGEVHIVDIGNRPNKILSLQGLPKHDIISALDFSPECEQLAIAADSKLYLVSLDDADKQVGKRALTKPLATWSAAGLISSVSYSPWDSLLAVGVGNGVKVLQIERGENGTDCLSMREIAHYNVGHFVSAVRFNHQGTEIWFGTGDGIVGVLAQDKPKALPIAA